MLLESALVAFVALDNQWEKVSLFSDQPLFPFFVSISCLHIMLYNFLQDLPLDPTGQLDTVRAFIEENIGICKWVGIVVMTIQVCFST